MEEEYTEPTDFEEPQKKPSKNIIIITSGIVIILLIILSIFLIQFFLSGKQPAISTIGEGVLEEYQDCCITYFESNFTDFSECPERYFLYITSTLIVKDHDLPVPKGDIDKEKLKDDRVRLASENGPLLLEYFVKEFENKYENANHDTAIIKEELINICLRDSNDISMCETANKILNIESEPYFSGVVYAKNYYEQKNFCPEDITSAKEKALCEAMAKRDKSFCTS